MMTIWLLTFVVTLAHAAVHLDVRARVRTGSGATVSLGQICDVDDPAVAAELAAVTVAKAPARLSAAELSAKLRPVVGRLRAAGKTVHVRVPEVVVIEGPLPLDAANVTHELLAAWALKCDGCHLEIENLVLPRVAAAGDWRVEAKELPRGGFSVPLKLTHERGVVTTAFVNGTLRVKRRVPVAKRLIGAGERLESSDFTFEERDVAQAFDGVPDQVPGLRARRVISAGETLWAGALEREKAVKRGDPVRLRADGGGWEVSINVTAPQDAGAGDVVSFKNPRGGALLVGRVTGPGEAEMR